MKPNSLFIIGCGDLGGRVADLLDPEDYRVWGVCRNPAALPDVITGHRADYTVPGSLAFLEGVAPDVVVATFKPEEFSERGYQSGFTFAMRNLLAGLGPHRPRLIIMVSSTRVFAEREGAWVDETSVLADEGHAAHAIIAAEQLLQGSQHRSCIVRFGGIYGGAQSRLLARVERGELCPELPVNYSNRIHRDDCAGFIAHLLALRAADRASVYVGVDDEPAPQFEVEQWLARQLGVEGGCGLPKERRGAGNKRCSNARLRQSGYTLRYPDYRSGYHAVLAARRSLEGVS